jgi:hypothetical protein
MSSFGKLKSDSGNTTFAWRPARVFALVRALTRASFVKYLSGRKLCTGNVAGWTEKRIYSLIRFCVVTATFETVLSLRDFISFFLLFVYFLPVPVAARSKTCVCGRSPAEIVFESHRGHGCLSVVSVVCCQVEVSSTSWSLVQKRLLCQKQTNFRVFLNLHSNCL